MSPRGVPPEEPADGQDLDAQWHDIVARLGDLAGPDEDAGRASGHTVARPDDPARRGGDPSGAADGPHRRRRTDRPTETGRTAGDHDESVPGDATDDGPTMSADPRAWAPDPAVEEAEDHFDPPDPGPVLGGDPLLTMAWAVVVAVPTLVVVALVAWRDIPSWLLQVGGGSFVAAIGLLLWRMPRDRNHDDPGAVV